MNDNIDKKEIDVFQIVCEALDDMKLRYKKDYVNSSIKFGLKGKDMNHDVVIIVNSKQEVIQVTEKLPIVVNSSRLTDMAEAVCLVNIRLLLGRFDFDMIKNLSFEITQIYSEQTLDKDSIKRMILALAGSVEEFDDKFVALNNGKACPDDFRNL